MKSIKDLPEFSRPREKLKEKGPQALSDAELVAVIIGSGGKDQDVMTLAAKIARLIAVNKDQLTLEKLLSIKGVGSAKASQIVAGFELARRYILKESIKITDAKAVLPLISFIASKKQEHFICVSLNGAHEVIASRVVTVGLVNRSQVHPREVYADVLTDRASSVIFAHNHPSGHLMPGENDLKIHKQLTEAGHILGITVLDHIIISQKGYYSFQELGLI
jgi:DNA repair protein RadC